MTRFGPTIAGETGHFRRTLGSIIAFHETQRDGRAGRIQVDKLDQRLTWDRATMAAFPAKPIDILPGTRMAFRGLKDQTEISDLIAYLGTL